MKGRPIAWHGILDSDRRMGRFILTGSQQLTTLSSCGNLAV